MDRKSGVREIIFLPGKLGKFQNINPMVNAFILINIPLVFFVFNYFFFLNFLHFQFILSGLPLPQLSNTLSNSRMVMAENMLTNANRILDRLNNPVNPTPDTSNERQSTSSTTTTTTENSDVNMDTSPSEYVPMIFHIKINFFPYIRVNKLSICFNRSSRSAPTSSGVNRGGLALITYITNMLDSMVQDMLQTVGCLVEITSGK